MSVREKAIATDSEEVDAMSGFRQAGGTEAIFSG